MGAILEAIILFAFSLGVIILIVSLACRLIMVVIEKISSFSEAVFGIILAIIKPIYTLSGHVANFLSMPFQLLYEWILGLIEKMVSKIHHKFYVHNYQVRHPALEKGGGLTKIIFISLAAVATIVIFTLRGDPEYFAETMYHLPPFFIFVVIFSFIDNPAIPISSSFSFGSLIEITLASILLVAFFRSCANMSKPVRITYNLIFTIFCPAACSLLPFSETKWEDLAALIKIPTGPMQYLLLFLLCVFLLIVFYCLLTLLFIAVRELMMSLYTSAHAAALFVIVVTSSFAVLFIGGYAIELIGNMLHLYSFSLEAALESRAMEWIFTIFYLGLIVAVTIHSEFTREEFEEDYDFWQPKWLAERQTKRERDQQAKMAFINYANENPSILEGSNNE